MSAVFGQRLTLLAIAPFLVANVLRTRGATSALARASAFSTNTHTTHLEDSRLNHVSVEAQRTRNTRITPQRTDPGESLLQDSDVRTRRTYESHRRRERRRKRGRERREQRGHAPAWRGERSRLVQSDDASSVARAALSGDAGEGARLSGETALLGRSVARQACLDGLCAAGFAALVALVNSKRARKPSLDQDAARLRVSLTRLPTGTMERPTRASAVTSERGGESS